jgi:hypothetical protein
MPRQVALRFFLACAILLAQQTALGHEYWHASAKPAGEKTLCDLHDLLGTVLGAACADAVHPDFLALSEPGFAAPAVAVREARRLTPHSRDPPQVS